MNKWSIASGLFCLSLIGSLFLTQSPVSEMVIAGGVMAILSGIGLIWTVILDIGQIRPKVYRFMHLYKRADFSDCETKIIAKLDKKGITHLLKKYNAANLKLLFGNVSPTLVETQYPFKIDNCAWIKVIGYVYASNEDEAITMITNEWYGSTSEDDTPDFFS